MTLQYLRASPTHGLLLALAAGCSDRMPDANSNPLGETGGTAAMAGAGGDSSGSAVTTMAGQSGSGDVGKLLVFSRTLGYRHSSIEPGVRALQDLARAQGFSLTATEDPSVFSRIGLSAYDAVLFLSTTGDVLDATQQAAFEEFIRSGHGFVGVHAASDTEYEWPWYGGLVGSYFRDHPPVQKATLWVEDSSHPATAPLANPWNRTDEWYAFRDNPRGQVSVLLNLDESTYSHDVGSMGADHPIAWYHQYDGGRAIYTGLGHTDESYQEAQFLEHLSGAIRWAAGW